MSAKINVVIIVGEYTKNILPVKSYVRTSEEQNSGLNHPDSSAHVALSLGHWYLIACFIYLFILPSVLGESVATAGARLSVCTLQSVLLVSMAAADGNRASEREVFESDRQHWHL